MISENIWGWRQLNLINNLMFYLFFIFYFYAIQIYPILTHSLNPDFALILSYPHKIPQQDPFHLFFKLN